MKQEYIPLLSYVFIGVTSLVLTYVTIADTTNEVITKPEPEPEPVQEPTVAPSAPTEETDNAEKTSMVENMKQTFNESLEKIKSMNPFSSTSPVETTAEVVNDSSANQNTIPVAVPVSEAKTSGGNKSTNSIKSIKRKKKAQKKTRRTRS